MFFGGLLGKSPKIVPKGGYPPDLKYGGNFVDSYLFPLYTLYIFRKTIKLKKSPLK